MSRALPEQSFRLLPHMVPHVRISPFLPDRWEDYASLALKAGQGGRALAPDRWLNDAGSLEFFDSGRSAIWACLVNEGLRPDDEVLIVKTFPGPYISSCVTNTIRRVCRWSQKFSSRTRLILVIHEFGFPCPEKYYAGYQKKGIPIVEDCAYGVGTRFSSGGVGRRGDYALYSLTKFFPVPFGGLLASRKRLPLSRIRPCGHFAGKRFMAGFIDAASRDLKSWSERRRAHWMFFARRLKTAGLRPYAVLRPGVVPGVFLAAVPKGFPGAACKARLVEAGVEATEYYGQGGFYFPVHQFLSGYEKEYILAQLFEALHKRR
ncbi:MAG: DegT/DnrJ/EryC1/StrS family aminotransferase [Candidatus Omnitrophota bacterium]|nr:DegT/DnrJ/EryC1/StrS family aminotransferase [Candidatus Omnitrophota bacterium]MDZ4243464.1 DegT/DnrJ/EryC1/StrS family aminotransferase [Candidatus Omnitrophota bacterium]